MHISGLISRYLGDRVDELMEKSSYEFAFGSNCIFESRRPRSHFVFDDINTAHWVQSRVWSVEPIHVLRDFEDAGTRFPLSAFLTLCAPKRGYQFGFASRNVRGQCANAMLDVVEVHRQVDAD
jgi:hypothetical protein